MTIFESFERRLRRGTVSHCASCCLACSLQPPSAPKEVQAVSTAMRPILCVSIRSARLTALRWRLAGSCFEREGRADNGVNPLLCRLSGHERSLTQVRLATNAQVSHSALMMCCSFNPPYATWCRGRFFEIQLSAIAGSLSICNGIYDTVNYTQTSLHTFPACLGAGRSSTTPRETCSFQCQKTTLLMHGVRALVFSSMSSSADTMRP